MDAIQPDFEGTLVEAKRGEGFDSPDSVQRLHYRYRIA